MNKKKNTRAGFGSKDIRVNARISASQFDDLQFIGKRLKSPKSDNGLYSVSAIICEMIAMTKKELTEPAIKFPDDHF